MTPASPPPSSTWICPTCTTTTHIFHRAAHLRTHTHIRNLLPTAIPARPRTHMPSQFLWRCVPCDEEMHVFYRDEHESSNQHARNTGVNVVPAVRERCSSYYRGVHFMGAVGGGDLFSGVFPLIQPAELTPEDPPRDELKCPLCASPERDHRCEVVLCDVCGVCVDRGHAATHMGSTRHRMAVEARWREEEEVAARQRGSLVGDILGGVQFGISQPVPAQSADAAVGSPAIAKVWTCTVCCKTMGASSQRPHLAGIKHRNRELRMRHNAEVELPKPADPKPDEHQQLPVADTEQEPSAREVESSRKSKHPRDCVICARVLVALSKLITATSWSSDTSDTSSDEYHTADETWPGPAELPRMVLILRITPSASASATVRPVFNSAPPPQLPLAPGQWHCALCDRTMPVGSRNHHAEGRQHRARYREKMFPDDRPMVPKRFWRRPGEEFVYCDCGKKLFAGAWCGDCDFRADAGWGKKSVGL